MPAEATSLVVAGAIMFIALNPLLFSGVEPVRRWVLARQLNPGLRCAVVAHTEEEVQWLGEAGVNEVLRSQQALALVQALARVVAA